MSLNECTFSFNCVDMESGSIFSTVMDGKKKPCQCRLSTKKSSIGCCNNPIPPSPSSTGIFASAAFESSDFVSKKYTLMVNDCHRIIQCKCDEKANKQAPHPKKSQKSLFMIAERYVMTWTSFSMILHDLTHMI